MLLLVLDMLPMALMRVLYLLLELLYDIMLVLLFFPELSVLLFQSLFSLLKLLLILRKLLFFLLGAENLVVADIDKEDGDEEDIDDHANIGLDACDKARCRRVWRDVAIAYRRERDDAVV